VRKATTLLTILVIASVVGVLAWMLGFASALEGSLAVAASADKIVVLKRGATAESNSAIPIEDYNKLTQLTGLASDPEGNSLISPEMMVQVSLPRVRDGGLTFGNVAVRGVTQSAFLVHAVVRPEGPGFSEAEPQVIVGKAAAEQFAGLAVGDSLKLGFGNDRLYRVVGHFSAGGGPVESEVWGYLPSLMNAYNRSMYSSVWLRLAPQADPAEAIGRIEGPAIQMEGQTEADYWEAQSRNVRTYLRVAYVLVTVMSLAAAFSIANTMFSMVAGRTREVAMLRTIGYSRERILTGFVLESVMLSLLGGLLGCAACYLWLEVVSNTKDMFGASTFTTMAFEIRLTPAIVALALLSVSLVGVLGAVIPAWRAAHLGVVAALREP
jgi:putative ABC transport system permease protein